MIWPHTGVILTGGQSRRMGQPKHAIMMPDGRTMIEHVSAIMHEVCARVIVSGPDDVLPDLPHVHDTVVNVGPIAGIEAVLASERDQQYLFCPCDMPRLSAAMLRQLLHSSADACAFGIRGESRPRPLPLRISAPALEPTRALLQANRRSIRGLLDMLRVDTCHLAGEPVELMNVNDPQELAQLLARSEP